MILAEINKECTVPKSIVLLYTPTNVNREGVKILLNMHFTLEGIPYTV
jgi:hypothetical protein